MKAFITGATGFVGRNLILWLNQHQPDLDMICLARNPQKAEYLDPLGIPWVHGDMMVPQSYQAAAQSCDLIFHVGGQVGLKEGDSFYPANSGAMNLLLDVAAGANHLQRLVYVSSISAVERPATTPLNAVLAPLDETCPAVPTTDYGKSKQMGEVALAVSGIPYSILRPSYIYGPYPRPQSSMDRVVYDIARQLPYTRFPFPGSISEIYVEDMAEALWIAATHPGVENEAFFISNPKPVAITELFRNLAHAIGCPYMPYMVSPKARLRIQQRLVNRATSPSEKLLNRILFENYFTCTPGLFTEKTGYSPRHSLTEGLIKTLAWYRQENLLPQGFAC